MSGTHFREIISSYVWANPRWMLTSIVLMIINFPLEIILLSFLSGRIFLLMGDIKNNYARIIRLVMYFFIAYFVIELSLVIRDGYDAIKVPELEKQIRNHIITMILEKNEIHFDHMAMGELVVRFLKAPIHSYYAYNIFLKFVVPFVLAVMVIGIYVWYLNPRLGVLYFIIYSIYLVAFYGLCRIMIRKTEEKMKAEMLMFNQLEDTLENMQTIFTSDTIQKEKAYMDQQQMIFMRAQTSEQQLNARFKLILSIASLLSVIFLFGYSMRLFLQKRMRADVLVSVITLLLYMVRFLGFTARRVIEGMITIGSMLESNQFLERLRMDTFQDGEAIDFISRGEIVLEKISFRYQEDSPFLLERFSLVIPAHSRILLIGDSGSGKTTFLRLLLGFFTLQSGSIRIDGVDIARSKRSYLRRKIAYINQNTRLFDRTIMENILYGCDPSMVNRQNVIDFIRDNHLATIFEKMGGDLEQRVGRGGERLSGGMRQIVLLLRCYFRDSPIVILDEVTSNIDARHRAHAIRIIRTMFVKKTVIAVSHDKDIFDLFDTRLTFSFDHPPLLTGR